MEEPVHRTRALTVEPAAAQAGLRGPTDTAGLTRAGSLGLDDELTAIATLPGQAQR
jgi:hypothetical protein